MPTKENGKMKELAKKFYKSSLGYLLFWTLMSLAVSYLASLSGGATWEETKSWFFDTGVIGLYAGLIGGFAPHTRFVYSAHNWILAVMFWWLSNWHWLQGVCENSPDEGAYLIALLGIWLFYSKTESHGFYTRK